LGENTRDEGFVIYEKTEGVEEINDENVEWAKRNINQYVWIPVDDFNDFKRDNFMAEELVIGNVPGNIEEYWEVQIDETTNMPVVGQSTTYASYVTPETEAEAIAMYNSVKKYGGFYVARYELGIAGNTLSRYATPENKSTIYSQMNKTTYGRLTKNEAINISRSIYTSGNDNYGVVSTLMYGVQFDTMLKLFSKKGLDLASSEWIGNRKSIELNSSNFENGAKYIVSASGNIEFSEVGNNSKAIDEIWLLSTGAIKQGEIYNVKDILGNMTEITMEGKTTDKIYSRGGLASTNTKARGRNLISATHDALGARVSLYIK